MKKQIKSQKRRNKHDLLIAFAMIFIFLAISPTASSTSSIHSLSSASIGHASVQISTNSFNVGNLGVTLASNESFKSIKGNDQIDITFLLGGIGAAILLGFGYTSIIKGKSRFTLNLHKSVYSLKTGKTKNTKEAVSEKIVSKEPVLKSNVLEKIFMLKIVHATVAQKVTAQEDLTTEQLRLYIAVPILFIAIAELLILLGKTYVAACVHAIILLTLALSNLFVKDPKVYKIYMSVMLLPLLRLVNLSMPFISDFTLFTHVMYYVPMAIPVATIIIHQRDSLKEIGITSKHLSIYLVLAVPLSFMLGLGEYLIIHPEHLIPDLSFKNLLLLTISMVFFVSLIEELIFRSILQIRLEQVLTESEALLITSILFGLMHSGYGTFYEMLYAGFVGLFLGLIFYKTKSLPFIAVLHGFVNVFLFGILPFFI